MTLEVQRWDLSQMSWERSPRMPVLAWVPLLRQVCCVLRDLAKAEREQDVRNQYSGFFPHPTPCPMRSGRDITETHMHQVCPQSLSRV